MTKTQAAAIFGNQTKLGEAIGISRAAISQWPDKLTQKQVDRVIGAAIRLGKWPPQRRTRAIAA